MGISSEDRIRRYQQQRSRGGQQQMPQAPMQRQQQQQRQGQQQRQRQRPSFHTPRQQFPQRQGRPLFGPEMQERTQRMIDGLRNPFLPQRDPDRWVTPGPGVPQQVIPAPLPPPPPPPDRSILVPE